MKQDVFSLKLSADHTPICNLLSCFKADFHSETVARTKIGIPFLCSIRTIDKNVGLISTFCHRFFEQPSEVHRIVVRANGNPHFCDSHLHIKCRMLLSQLIFAF